MAIVSKIPGSASIARFVESFHYIENAIETPVALECILPGGRIDLMVNLHEDQFRTYSGASCGVMHRTGGAVLGGPRAKPTVIDTAEMRCLVTVNFKEGGAAPFFKAPMCETCDQLVELDLVWGRDGAVLRERLLEARAPETKLDVIESVMLDRLECDRERSPAMLWAAAAFERGLAVSEVCSRLGLLPKTFVRRFREEMGLAPKKFSRVRRLQRILRSTVSPEKADWAELAARHGYTDQAHLIHDFRDLTGMTPTTYRPLSPDAHNHVRV
jgi:AraC-like DNA-binding protein